MNISALLVTMVVTFLIPAVVALLTKSTASVSVKQFITAALAAITGVIVAGTQLDGTAFISKEAVLLALGAFILTQATYVGIYKPRAINDKIAPGAGLG